MATAISVIGLLVAAVIFVIAVWKGLDVFTSTILVSFIIILTSWMNWWDVRNPLQTLSQKKWVRKE